MQMPVVGAGEFETVGERRHERGSLSGGAARKGRRDFAAVYRRGPVVAPDPVRSDLPGVALRGDLQSEPVGHRAER